MKHLTMKLCALTCLLSGELAAEPAQYATPQDALDAMMSALSAGDRDAALTVFGKEAEDFLSDGDPAEDAANRQTILTLYREGFRMVPQEDGSIVIAFGAEGWPFPIPIAKDGDSWAFDIETGRQEVLAREIGLNELEIVELLRAYVEIQAGFRSQDLDGDGVMEFASQIISDSETERNGLFWVAPDSPLGARFARASATGYNDGEEDQEPEPYSGYYFRILTKQSDAAPGGAMDYMVNGNMVGGHAILAVPAIYGETGVHSFMVSENGQVLEAILGDETLAVAAEMDAYDPSEEWSAVEP